MRTHRTVTALVAASIALTLLGACGDDDGGEDTASDFPCGTSPFGETSVRVFCGDGSITVRAGATTLELDDAECETTDEFVSVNAGTFVIPTSAIGASPAAELRASVDYAGVTVGRYEGEPKNKPADSDGTYQDGVLTFSQGTAENVRSSSLRTTLSDGRTTGEFTGELADGTAVTGSFTC